MIRLLGDRVLVERKQAEKKTSSGLFIPDAAQKDSGEATVIAVGSGCKADLKVGDSVLFNRFAGQQISDGLLLREDDIYLVFE